MPKFRSDLGTLILATIGASELHGYEILKRIRRHESEPFRYGEGQIYPVLHRLEEDHLISSTWQDQPDGRPRRELYGLTDKGRKALDSSREEWKIFSRSMEVVLRPQESN